MSSFIDWCMSYLLISMFHPPKISVFRGTLRFTMHFLLFENNHSKYHLEVSNFHLSKHGY